MTTAKITAGRLSGNGRAVSRTAGLLRRMATRPLGHRIIDRRTATAQSLPQIPSQAYRALPQPPMRRSVGMSKYRSNEVSEHCRAAGLPVCGCVGVPQYNRTAGYSTAKPNIRAALAVVVAATSSGIRPVASATRSQTRTM